MNIPLREIFGKALAELGGQNKNVVVLDADLANATRSILFWEKYPGRFFNMGIAEANMVSVAAGLSTCGKIPYVCTFSFLLSLRAADQIRSQISYPNLNVKLIGTNAGLSGFGDGVTHQSIMDLAIFRAMPNFTIVVPSDDISVEWIIREASSIDGPFFIRIPRVEAPRIHPDDKKLKVGKALVIREGRDLTIFSNGMMIHKALEAALQLENEGISIEIIEIHTLKPLDEGVIIQSVKKTGAAVVLEEHNCYGGLCSAIAEITGQVYPVPLEFVAINDRFASSGPYEEILNLVGLGVENVVLKAKQVLERRINKDFV